MNLFSRLIIILSIITSSALSAQAKGLFSGQIHNTGVSICANPQVLIYDTATDLSGTFEAENIHYITNRKGLTRYMHYLQANNESAYSKILPYYKSLEADYEIAFYATLTSGIIGSSLLGGGAALYYYTSYTLAGTIIMLAGATVDIAAIFSYVLMTPDDKDMVEFINTHNKINPKFPIKLQLGIVPLDDSNSGSQFAATVSYHYRF